MSSSPPPKHSLSSPTSGNTPHPVLPTPSSSTSVSIRQNNLNKSNQLRLEIEQQLAEKQKQVLETSSGIGRNVLLRQVSQLQDRLKELDSTSSDEFQPNNNSVDRLRSFERDLTSYNTRTHPLSPMRNKEKLLNQRSSTSTGTNSLDPLPSPSTSTLLPPPAQGHDSTSLLPLPPPPTGSTPTKRRSKIPNTDRRNTDIEFATEIGQGLLLEVRKMQALLQEKEEKLRTLENQKADLERAAEAMAKQMRQREENEEKLKEETWNLELAKQELTISVTELQQNLSKANVEQNKLAKQVNQLRSEIEQLRDREEKLTTTIENMKQRHEQDMSSIRRHAAAIQREKTDQTKQIEALTSELAIAKAQSRIAKHVTTESEPSKGSGEPVDDQTASILAVKNDSSPIASPPSSPKQAPTRNQAMEVETLKTSLAHAHRMVSNLRSNLHKEKTEKFEFKKLLADSQETIEQLQNDPRMWVDASPARSGNNSTSNFGTREDGVAPGRRPHKASTSSSTKRRNGNKKNMGSGRHKLKGSSQNATADDNSVYSYSSMSDQDDSEELDSFDDSDAGFDTTPKKKSVGFTPLSSELSQVQMQKPVVVDAQVNTDPVDNEPVLDNQTRSLGDELGMAMSQPQQDDSVVVGGLVAGAAAAIGVESLIKKEPGIEISIQTDLAELEQVSMSTMSIEPIKPVELEYVSQQGSGVEPEDPAIALAAIAAAEATTAAAIIAGIAKSRQDSLDAAIDSETQYEPEDPSIALAAAEAATAAAIIAGIAKYRQDTLETAVDSSVQCDEEETEDPSIVAAAIASGITSGIVKSRQDALEAAIDTSVQCDQEDPAIAEALTAAAIAKSRQDALDIAVNTATQSEVEDPSIALKAAEVAALATVAAVAAGIAKHRQDALEAAIDISVQCEEPTVMDQIQSIDSGVQSEVVETKDVSVQSEYSTTAEETAATTVDHETQYDISDIDHTTQSKVAETMECGVQSDLVSTKDANVQHEVESTDIAVQSEDSTDKGVTAIIPLPPVSNRTTYSESGDEFFDASSDSKPSSKRTINSVAPIKPIDTAIFALARMRNNKPALDRSISSELLQKDVQELSNAAPSEKMYSKSETDALIATAVALALAKAAEGKTVETKEEVSEENKRHTCDMSSNQETDSVVDEDEHDGDQEYGNVVVHLPREEDTVTSLPYGEIAHQQLDRDLLLSKPTQQADPVQEEKRPELTIGLSIVFAQEPEQPEIPQRPTNPPPTALLSRAGLSPTLTENRSMSPSSMRSKGKAPMDYSDLESQSAPSNEDLQRTAALQQSEAKRSSVSASSISTSNTNEQLHSVNSSQYDALARNTSATDPTMINLITQTMIGDWLYKYTRKTVGGGLSERRHKRYFWIHPYTRTLYWSTTAPGVDGNEAKAKSASIENITPVPDYTHVNDGTPNVSLLIQTSHRQLKLTAPNMEKHEIWFEAISHLLSRNKSGSGLTTTLLNDARKATTTGAENPNNRSISSATSGSLLNRPSFRRLHDIFQHQPSSSSQSMATSNDADHVELDDDDEALEDVRMCCNGKHHVSKLEKDHTHRQQYRKRKSRNTLTTVG